MNELLQRLLTQTPLTAEDAAWVRQAEWFELNELLEQLAATLPDSLHLEPLCALIGSRLHDNPASEHQDGDGALLPLSALYDALSPENPSRGAVLQSMLEDRSEHSLALVAERLNHDPPRTTASVVQALSVLYREPERASQALALVERCWPALEHVNVASPLLDLMNYLCRKHAVEHPASARWKSLLQLLEAVVARLEHLSASPPDDDESRALHQAIVEEGVPLCVSLCDALALIGEPATQATLHHALELPHRRIRTEAAWGLARLGEATGERVLLEQVVDPYTRLRALEYLQELELVQRVAAEYLDDSSKAEAALCAWLAEPAQFGVPPHELQLLEHRVMYWPGFEEEQDCFLFRFVYRLPQGVLANLGISGPVEHAFATDLTRMTHDDAFAMFAGWHADHEEMEDVIPEQLSTAGRLEMERLVRRLRDCGYQDIEPMLFCQFFGDKALVAQATNPREAEQGPGWAVADAVDDYWLPGAPRFGPVEASYVYKGRRLLHAFNDDDQG